MGVTTLRRNPRGKSLCLLPLLSFVQLVLHRRMHLSDDAPSHAVCCWVPCVTADVDVDMWMSRVTSSVNVLTHSIMLGLALV